MGGVRWLICGFWGSRSSWSSSYPSSIADSYWFFLFLIVGRATLMLMSSTPTFDYCDCFEVVMAVVLVILLSMFSFLALGEVLCCSR